MLPNHAPRSWRRAACLATALLCGPSHLRADELPAESDRAPVAVPHFPDALHAVVWRNWQLVSPERLAAVLETTPDKVRQLAAAMGLPPAGPIPAEIEQRGYITLLRRNWHLLPFNQLVALLDISPAELASRLREDDFLYYKLGGFKPKCPRVTYVESAAAAHAREAEIKQLVERQFGQRLSAAGEPRFAFVGEFGKAPSQSEPQPAAGSAPAGLRFIYSYFAMYGDPLSDPKLDPYPDGLLARLRDVGVNGVWLHVVLRQLAPGGADFPEFGAGHEERLKNLRNLAQRAERFGIKVYLYINEPRAMPESFFKNRPEMAGVRDDSSKEHVAMCTSNPRVRQWVSDSLAHVFQAVPGLGGVFTISASENLTNCSSHFRQAECPHCRDRTATDILVEINTTIAEGVHRAAPDAKVIVWDWGWATHGDASEMIAKLPSSVWLMSVSEWQLPIERGGVKTQVGEYSMSAVGPGPRALRHWQVAKEHGLKTVAKVQFNNTWELSAVPYLPVMDLVAEHNARLAAIDLDGLMLSWSLGGYPSPNLALAARFSARPAPEPEAVLEQLAADFYGSAACPQVRAAWTKFSRAFAEYPYAISGLYSGPQHNGPANLLYEKPTGLSPGMVCFPYDALRSWCAPYPPEIFYSQFEKVAAGWAAGLQDLQAAQPLVEADKRAFAAGDLRVARAAQLHFASVANQVRFILDRDALAAAESEADRQRLRDSLNGVLERETQLASQLYDIATFDSRIGYEASNHYFYVPLDLVEKTINCAYLKTKYAAPAK